VSFFAAQAMFIAANLARMATAAPGGFDDSAKGGRPSRCAVETKKDAGRSDRCQRAMGEMNAHAPASAGSENTESI